MYSYDQCIVEQNVSRMPRKDLIQNSSHLRKHIQRTAIRDKRHAGVKRIVTIGKEKAFTQFQLVQRCFNYPSLFVAIFGPKYNRIDHQHKMKMKKQPDETLDSTRRHKMT